MQPERAAEPLHRQLQARERVDGPEVGIDERADVAHDPIVPAGEERPDALAQPRQVPRCDRVADDEVDCPLLSTIR